MDRTQEIAAGAATGIAVGGGTYALVVARPVLAGGLAVVYALAAGLTVAHWPALQRHRSPGPAGWYSAIWAVLVTGAALFAVGSAVADPERRYALGMLVVGVGYASYLIGSAGERAARGNTDAPAGER